MRKLALLLIVLLVFNVTAPYQALAVEGDESEQIEVPEGTQNSDSTEQLDEEVTSTEESVDSVSEGTDSSETGGSVNKDTASTEETDKTDDTLDKENIEDAENSSTDQNTSEEVDQEDEKVEEKAVDSEKSAEEEKQTETNQPNDDSETEGTTEDEESTSDSTEEKAEIQSFKMTEIEIPVESSTSRLGHLHGDAVIYSDLEDLSASVPVADTYTNAVYYIKKQAKLSGQTYYLISKKPSSSEGVVGWVKASDMQTFSHKTVDHQSKTFYIKGTGSAYSKAWGGSKDLVFGELTDYRNAEFKVNLTETVGDNVWYRGTLDGKTVWLHSSYVSTTQAADESATSRLGHLRGDAIIYYDLNDLSSSKPAADTYTNAVYYIKKQAILSGQKYYLISKEPSSVDGVVGWVEAQDMVTNSHKTADHDAKTFYIKGTGSAYSKAWGGSKDLIYENMTGYKNQEFKVNLTETVGENVWYRGELNGKTIWLHSSFVTNVKESTTSRLGHLREDSVIFDDLGDLSSYKPAADTYTNAVYYIKKQAELGGTTYYLISRKPSSTEGVVGWTKAKDMVTYSHKTADHNAKTFYIKGTGSAYSKVWGGSKDLVYEKMSDFRNLEFKVNLTEKVGENVWYRGKLNGKTVWLHSSYVSIAKETTTSRLGHLRGDAVIFDDLNDLTSSKPAADTYTNTVYYIKKQAELAGEKYYLISKEPSSVNGVVGWVKTSDMVTYSHKTADHESKTFYIKGTGSAYSKPWGGFKDLVYKDLSSYSDESFKVNLTEKVGNNVWYRGTLKGKTIWLHSSYVLNTPARQYTRYDISLAEAIVMQMKVNPQTDREYDSYVSKTYIKDGRVTADTLNVRGGPSTDYWVIGQLNEGDKVTVVNEKNGWYQIRYTESRQWVNASPEDTLEYLDPNNYINDPKQQFQFLDLSKSNVATASVLNNYLRGKGILDGKGATFLQAGNENGISEVYLVSHALLETGNGTADLAVGVPVDKNGNVTFVNGKPAKTSATVTTVYNMYGIHAFDSCPLTCGAKKAFNEGWNTPEKAIIGGANFIKDDYISSGKNTIYKMRWNPLSMEKYGYASGQYATDIGWASKQIYSMYNLYQQLDSYVLYLDIPKYRE
ncbi:N-acetylglucosaminidase [Sediminibacillus halophilus]|uniref:Bifunctional autolysin n=1 Tax=Sediminibacillus halophilus TaxID=482461 RepID=A0A1G9U4F5_9BACI|nr:GW dipeptide domain-containing protein [Sediminibacillus halophilus]SDM54869.1 bifunctional autolysin [Sediminibacillus halophilus]